MAQYIAEEVHALQLKAGDRISFGDHSGVLRVTSLLVGLHQTSIIARKHWWSSESIHQVTPQTTIYRWTRKRRGLFK